MQNDSRLILSPSPHVWDSTSTSNIMFDVVVALLPTLFASIWIFGAAAISPLALCIITAVLFEWAYQKMMKKPVTIGDYSALVTGILMGFNLPAGVPAYVSVFSTFVAIVVVKQLFGGLGQNFANPAITARIIAMLCFGMPMSTFLLPAGGGGDFSSSFGVDIVAGATPLSIVNTGKTAGLPSLVDMLLGFRGGALGETCALTLILGGLYLIWRKVITYHIPLAYLGGVAAFSVLFGVSPVYSLLSGGVILAAFFMATDYVTSPITAEGKLVFGLGCALITMVIRVFGSLPEGASYSVLIMNIISPHIATLTTQKPFGGVQK